MNYLERSKKEELLCDLLMDHIIKEPSCIEGFLHCFVPKLNDQELDEELSLWSN
jgi:hypothetical protein